MGVEYRVLGPLEVLVEGRIVDVGPPRHRGVLVLMIAHANTVVPAHHLIEALWDDGPPSSAGNLVQGAVSGLRKTLGKDAITTRGTGYALRVEPESLDLHRFERLARAGSVALDDGHLERAATILAEALALWRGPALADLSDERFGCRGGQIAAGRKAVVRVLRHRPLQHRIDRGRQLGSAIARGFYAERSLAELEGLSADPIYMTDLLDDINAHEGAFIPQRLRAARFGSVEPHDLR